MSGVYENLIYRKSSMAERELALYVNLFLTARSRYPGCCRWKYLER